MVVEATPPVPLFTVVVCHDARSRWSVNWKEATMKKREKKKRKKEERRKKNLDLAHSWHLIRQGYSISVSWTVSIDERRYKCVERYKREGGGGKWKMVRDVYRRGEWQKREREREIFLRKRDDWKEGFWKMTFPRARGVDEDQRGFLSRRWNRMLMQEIKIFACYSVYRGKFH